MLVLNCLETENVIITVPPSDVEQRIRVTAVDTRHNRVRIGFDAAKHIAIHREKVQQRVDAGEDPDTRGNR